MIRILERLQLYIYVVCAHPAIGSRRYQVQEKMKVIIVTPVVVLLTLLNVALTLGGWDRPIPPIQYQTVIGQGLSAGFFKGRTYNSKMVKDVSDAGFTNLRLRCQADMEGREDFSSEMFKKFLKDLSTVVDDCLYYNITPIISWSHDLYTANTTVKNAKKDFVGWWGKVAKKLKDKDYRLGFNLITELANHGCKTLYKDCSNGLKDNPGTYNDWTKAAIAKIRATGGNNAKRIVILAAPQRLARSLPLIDDSIYKKDKYLMVECHTYAAGPNQNIYKNGSISFNHWVGNGTEEMRSYVHRNIKFATDYTASTGILTYWGAWMPLDNHKGSLTQSEVINFARYFIQALGQAKIPWSLNSLFWYYKTNKLRWVEATEERDNHGTKLYMYEILEEIKDAMAPYTPYANQ